MSRYDGLIIPRSYSEYINKTDAATLSQALQLSGVLSGTVAAGDNKAVKSDAVNTAIQHQNNNAQVSYFNNHTPNTKLYYIGYAQSAINQISFDVHIIANRVDGVADVEVLNRSQYITKIEKNSATTNTSTLIVTISETNKYNVYMKLGNYTPNIQLVLSNLRNFTIVGEYVDAITGTEVQYT